MKFLPCRPIRQILNPIEQLFAKLKALLRKTAARTVEVLSAPMNAQNEILRQCGLWTLIVKAFGGFGLPASHGSRPNGRDVLDSRRRSAHRLQHR